MIRHIFLDKSATLIKDSEANTGLNPVAELNYGMNVTRFIVHFDLGEVEKMWKDRTINLNNTTFTLKMTNCTSINGVPYEKPLFFGNTCATKERASSFTVLALRLEEDFDAGRGFKYLDDTWITSKKSFSDSGCNWYQSSNGNRWKYGDGVYPIEKIKEEYDKYDAIESGTADSGVTTLVIDRQHFDFGDEQLQIDVTDYVKSVILDGERNHGILLCFTPALEGLNGGAIFGKIRKLPFGEDYATYDDMPSNKDVTVPDYFEVRKPIATTSANCTTVASGETVEYEVSYYRKLVANVGQQYVGFFTNHTNTFFHPYVEMDYKEVIQDDRECFYCGKVNRLYLYSNINGRPENLDELPVCKFEGEEVPVTQATKGVYYAEIDLRECTKECICDDVWSNLKYDGAVLDDVELEAVVLPRNKFIQVGSSDVKHEHLVPQVYGINDDECVRQGEVREVVIDFRRKYTTNERQTIPDAVYRLYTKDGERQIDILNGYQPVERSFLHNYFLLYTSDLIPNNKYYVDIKIRDGREERFYEDVLHFRIVDDVTERYA